MDDLRASRAGTHVSGQRRRDRGRRVGGLCPLSIAPGRAERRRRLRHGGLGLATSGPEPEDLADPERGRPDRLPRPDRAERVVPQGRVEGPRDGPARACLARLRGRRRCRRRRLPRRRGDSRAAARAWLRGDEGRSPPCPPARPGGRRAGPLSPSGRRTDPWSRRGWAWPFAGPPGATGAAAWSLARSAACSIAASRPRTSWCCFATGETRPIRRRRPSRPGESPPMPTAPGRFATPLPCRLCGWRCRSRSRTGRPS